MVNPADTYRSHHADGTITDRQLEIVLLRHRGLSQNAIALGLGISRSTVRYLERTAHANIQRRKDTA